LLEVIPKRGTQPGKIIHFLQLLSQDPFVEGDYTDKDITGRARHIKIIGDFAITYWVDHPAKAVIVVDIALADK
jgi:hypothetical protein